MFKFNGQFLQTIDGKGRVSVPMKFREGLQGSRLMITHFTMQGLNCLDVFPMGEWAELGERISQLSPFDPNLIWLETFYVGAACEIEVDPQGRILVPTALRKEANLEREIMIAGALSKFRIFSKEAWDEAKSNAKEKLMHNSDQLKSLSESLRR